MAHSLFEPAPTPFSEKIWRRVKHLNFGLGTREPQTRGPIDHAGPVSLPEAMELDARGRQQLLDALLRSHPICGQKQPRT